MLIGTHSSNPQCSTEHIQTVKQTLIERYPRSKYKGFVPDNIFAVDSSSSSQIFNLRERLAKLVNHPSFADRLFPKMTNPSWLLFREYLANEVTPYLLKEDLAHALETLCIPEEQMSDCLIFLESFMSIITFPLHSKGRFLLVRDLSWWNLLLKRVLDPSNPSLTQGSLITRQHLIEHLGEHPPAFLEDLLLVLEEFDVIQRLPNSLIVSFNILFSLC